MAANALAVKLEFSKEDAFRCIKDVLMSDYGITLDELKRICNAKWESRLVMMPCKPGDTVYQIDGHTIVERTVSAITIEEWGLSYEFWIDGFGAYRTSQKETVFFSRDEAQAVLDRHKHFIDRFTEVK